MERPISACGASGAKFTRTGVLAAASLAVLLGASSAVGAGDGNAPVEPTDTLEATHLQARFQDIAQNASKSVVAISASFSPADDDSALRSDELNPDKLEVQLDRTTRTVGSGMIISADGYILTNEHVVAEGQQLWVTTDDHKVYPAMIVGSDPRADLAVIKIPAEGLLPVQLNDAPAHRGQWTIAIGNPLGLAEAGEMAFSVGVVSATERSLAHLSNQENRLYNNLIQTTAQINPGNSGGPLFDLDGRVIGINAAVILPQKQTNGIGFAMPINHELLDEMAQLRDGREIAYGYIGVNVSTPSARERELALVPEDQGVMIDSVDPDERAAGILKPGDIVYSFDGIPVTDSDQFVRIVGRAQTIDRTVKVLGSRDGRLITLSLRPRKRQLAPMAVCHDSQRLRWHGMLLGPVPLTSPSAPATSGEAVASAASGATANVAGGAACDISSGVMVFGIEQTSPARKEGIVSGSIITAVAGHPVPDILSLQRLVNDTPLDDCQIITRPQTAIASNTR